MLLRPAFENFQVSFATTDPELGVRAGIDDVLVLPDANRNRPLQLIRCFFAAWSIVRGAKPDFIITTGALPGLLCLVAGRWNGAKTIWIDSVANSEQLSFSGKLAQSFSTLSITQWEHLAQPPRLLFEGRLL
ncbi:glucuronosyltransferase [Sphingomonas sp.]|uniref:glucuronosyltransferase n=1 Tax=Sphingomonas sp. TaxID=28214 RepID=UPI0025F67F15|nr:glucuronosyltransferase [Sphingomonas sp.]